MKPSITSGEKISDGQKQSGIELVVNAVRKAMGVAIDELSKNGVISIENFQKVLGQGDKIASAVTTLVKQKMTELAENIVGCLKLISGAETLLLPPTSGKETIAKATDLFTGYIDSDFKSYGCDVKGKPTGDTKVVVCEMVKDADFKGIFGGLNVNLGALCLTQHQIIEFVRKYRAWLRSDGYATFFLFKAGDEFFVARVRFDVSGRLKLYVDRFSYVSVWDAEIRHRVVVPQLAL